MKNTTTHVAGPMVAADDCTYEPVPLVIAFVTRVKYKYVGELQPLPYPLDSDSAVYLKLVER